ncbi:hypothetical protein B0H65DRAFT_459562 [Neurospora tetraspora]|uniref:Uncharacterized protein n=1 Tax=Neurospora tetraspora TaxID=94610 RepID=A0AAE0JLR6_9PEZI|nr:hypothetical protein B0H65DRAFT_459562 [Neurospora tetraspora]
MSAANSRVKLYRGNVVFYFCVFFFVVLFVWVLLPPTVEVGMSKTVITRPSRFLSKRLVFDFLPAAFFPLQNVTIVSAAYCIIIFLLNRYPCCHAATTRRQIHT